MSALGHKRTLAVQNGMSALPPKATSNATYGDVRFGPIAYMRYLLDDLVSSQEERLWDGEAECFGSLEVDDELKLGRVLHRQVGRLSAAEYAVDIFRPPSETDLLFRSHMKSV